MAYMSQEQKARLAALLKTKLQGTGIRYSLAVRHHSTIVLTLREGPVDFFSDQTEVIPEERRTDNTKRGNIDTVNPYHYPRHFTGRSLEILTDIFEALNNGNHDRSDLQSDYFNVGWYVDVNVGRWDRPYVLTTREGGG